MIPGLSLLTGGSGYVGRALAARLSADGVPVRLALRPSASAAGLGERFERAAILGLTPDQDWSAALAGVQVVVHAAARVHVMAETSADPIAEFRAVNVAGTLNLARQAAAAGVQRFVFVSSVKVNGEGTLPGRPYRASDTPAPQDPYGISKHEAEVGLRAIAAETGMELVIVRPPLVYGPGVKANFASMMRWVARGVPLPLGAIDNRRSLVGLGNLVDLLVTCMHHPAAPGQTFLASDNDDVSTTELLRRVGIALGRPARLVPVPPAVIKAGAALVGKPAVAQRLCDSLQLDISPTLQTLGWQPPVSMQAGLDETARHFLSSR